MTNITRTLRWFSKHSDSDTVTMRVRTVILVDDQVVVDTETDQYGSDGELSAAAAAAQKTTWDEAVIRSVYGFAE